MTIVATETLVDRLHRFGREHAHLPALQDASGTLSWSELDQATNRIANALLAAGLKRGDRVALITETTTRAATLILGIIKAGGSAVPIPTLIAADAIERVVEDSGAQFLFLSQSLRRLVTPRLEAKTIRKFGIDFFDGDWHPLSAFLRDASAADPGIRPTLQDEFNVIYSSGTTGRPKGIVHDHMLRAVSAMELADHSYPIGARTITSTALFSNWTMGALIYTLWAGGFVRFLGKFSLAELKRACDAMQPNNVYLVPAQVARLFESDETTGLVSSLKPTMKWCAGSFLATDLKRKLLEHWPGGFIEIYGMTEGAPFTVLVAHARPDKLHTVGQSDPIEDLKIIDDNGRELPIGERGEIVGRARVVMGGYNNDSGTTNALVWHDSDGIPYFRSGDIGLLDDERFLQVTDRKKDMIISGGLNIYASDMEQVLLSHPAVAEAAVFGLPSPKWGESPVAAVVLKSSATLSEPTLLAWANERLGKVQQLRALAMTDELPRGSLDKILKRELRARYTYLSQGIE